MARIRCKYDKSICNTVTSWQTSDYIFFSPTGRKLVVDFYEGDKVASTLVSDDEEDDRDNIVPL